MFYFVYKIYFPFYFICFLLVPYLSQSFLGGESDFDYLNFPFVLPIISDFMVKLPAISWWNMQLFSYPNRGDIRPYSPRAWWPLRMYNFKKFWLFGKRAIGVS